jgi:hypothetical protein
MVIPDDILEEYGAKLYEKMFVNIKEEKEDFNLNQINSVDFNQLDTVEFHKVIRYVRKLI